MHLTRTNTHNLLAATTLGLTLTACGGGGQAKWTWIDVPESKCAAGTPTGYGISPKTGSKRLMIYLEGGGSCHDMATCWTDPKAANTEGYDSTTFANDPKLKHYTLFNRKAASGNPFADANLVFIPYCTGDFHSGYNMQTLIGSDDRKDTYFMGGYDMDLFLADIRNTFPEIEQVWLVGTSAGGAGTIPNYFKVRDTFGVRTDIINDSGTPLPIPRAVDARDLWGTPVFPGCDDCTPEQQVQVIRAADPSSRYALMSYAYDNIVAKGYNIGLEAFNTQLNQTLDNFADDGNFASFIAKNPKSTPQHVIMGHYSNSDLMQAMNAWLKLMVDDSGDWQSVEVGNN